jgi:hypothetical protein
MSLPVLSTFTCPQCQQVDQVQNVSAIVGGGNAPGELPIVPGASFSLLAERLAPPEVPQMSGMLTPGEIVATIVMALLAFPAFAFALEAFRETRSLMVQAASDPLATYFVTMWKIALFASVVVLVLCLVGFAVTTQRYYQRQAEQRASLEEWDRARARWEQLYYCFRCNGAFIPGDAPQLVPVQRVPAFVFQTG